MKKLALVSLLALSASPALAQSDPGQPAAEAGGDTIVVTASRSGEGIPISQLGGSVTVIDADALDKRQIRIVSDVLRDVPGIAVSRTGGLGSFTQIRIRGTEGNHALVLIDGIEASDPYQGEYDFGTLIADLGAKVEVLRGQQSSLYGSDAMGGVVHYITLTGEEAPGFKARAEGGSFGTLAGAARMAGLAGDLDYAVSGSYYHTDGTPTARGGTRDVGSDSAGVSAKLIWSPGENFKLTGVARYNYGKADNNGSEQNTSSPLFGYIVDSPGEFFRNKAFYALVRAEFTALDGRWTNALTGQIADTTRKGFKATGLDYGDKGKRTKGSFESSLRLGSETVVHRLTAAVDVEREEFRNLTPFAFDGNRRTDNIGLVGQYELRVNDTLSLGASIRHDKNNRFDDPTTWRAQGSYSFATGTRVRTAYGTAVKNPGYFELYGYFDGEYIGNPNLKPETSEGWEAGVEQRIGEGTTLGLTYFDNRLKDEIFTTFPPPDFIATPGNRATKSRQHGIEFFASARPTGQVRLDAAYTYLKASENGVVEVRRPKHIGSVNLTVLDRDERFSGTLTVRYNGRQADVAFIDPSFRAVNVSLKDYVLVNMNAEYKITPNIAIHGRIENLANEDYEEVFSVATPGRAVYGGLRVDF